MELTHRPISLSGPFRWVTYPRINLVIAFVAGLAVGLWWSNGIATFHAQHACERNRAIAIDAGADSKRLPVCSK